MKITKFGGSSLANAFQIQKVCNIVLSDEERRVIVVSAPGKRTKDDIKVTDLLIATAKARLGGNSYQAELDKVIGIIAIFIFALIKKMRFKPKRRYHIGDKKRQADFQYQYLNGKFSLEDQPL